MFAKVELEPETPGGALLGLFENAPPERTESAARLSEAIAPVPS